MSFLTGPAGAVGRQGYSLQSRPPPLFQNSSCSGQQAQEEMSVLKALLGGYFIYLFLSVRVMHVLVLCSQGLLATREASLLGPLVLCCFSQIIATPTR